jgi:dTDP-4-amino-4,6-dideoxygalactose transaminase
MVIPLIDLKAQYIAIKDEIDAAMRRVVESAQFILGPEVEHFEQEFARFCGTAHAVGTSSGTSALHLALLTCGIQPGHEVITASHTFIAVGEAISHAGADAVFVDIDPETYTIDPAKIEEAITPRTRAIIAVHLYGQCADMEPILELARRHGLAVIEDAAQAHGAGYKDRRAGSIGDVGCFSFYPGKNVGAYGDGGMIVTNDSEKANVAKLLRNHGRRTKYEHLVEGYNYRLDELQAAILRVKLKHLPQWNEQRRSIARRYNELLADLPVQLPLERFKHVYHLYVIRSAHRHKLAQFLHEQDISTGIHYPIPLHLQPAYRNHPQAGKGKFPITEQCAGELLSLPMYPELTEEQIVGICEAIKRFYASL